MSIELIIWIGMALIGLIVASLVIYHIGYSAGYQDGYDRALDNVAICAERQRKFTGKYDEL